MRFHIFLHITNMKHKADICGLECASARHGVSKSPALIFDCYQHAMQLLARQQYAKAEALLRDILPYLGTVAIANGYQQPPLDAHSVRYALGSCLVHQGKWSEAVALLHDMLDMRSPSSLPIGDFRRLQAHNKLADLYLSMDRQSEAERQLELSAMAHHMQLGPLHPDTLDVCHNLAVQYIQAGKLQVAESILKSVYQIGMSQKGVGKTHERTCLTAMALGSCLLLSGRHAEAKPYLAHAVSVWAPKRAVTDPDLFSVTCDAAECLYHLGEYREAEEMFRLLISAHEQSGSKDLLDRESLQWAKYRLAASMGGQDSQKRHAAMPFIRKITAEVCAPLLPDDPARIKAQLSLAACLIGVHEYAEARALIGDLRAICAAKHGPAAAITLATEKLWATFLRKIGPRTLVKVET